MVPTPTVDRLLAFFRPDVLAPYRERPDRYKFRTDNFEGHVTLTSEYYAQLSGEQQDREYIDITFGFRTLTNGELCVAVFRHALTQISNGHLERWRPFQVTDNGWLPYDDDARFSLWYRRYAEGDWDVDNGPAFQLLEEIALINGLTLEAVGARLYETGDEPTIIFPPADNTWKYEDAHVSLYAILIDGLNMRCLRLLADRVGRKMDTGATRTLNALRKTLFPQLGDDPCFSTPYDKVSDQRAYAAHGVRPAAKPMKAFAEFSKDVDACLSALRLLKTTLENEMTVDADQSRRRQDAMKHLPRIVAAADSGDPIGGAQAMQGKTIEKVESGRREELEGVHQSEAIILHFTDGSLMSLDTGSNAGTLACDAHPPEAFHVDFRVTWVPSSK